VHWAGSPPTTTANGSAGGATLNIDVANVVITGYSATPSGSGYEQHYFKYDPDGGDPLDSPEVTATVDNWQNESMELVVWVIATECGDTRPIAAIDPYMNLAISAPGTYTLTWDGSNPGVPPLGWGPGEAPWGTYTYDIDVHKPSCAASVDHFFAKTHDGWSTQYETMYDVTFGDHSVQWTQETIGDPMVLRCTYEITDLSDVEPAWVELVPIDPDLNEQGWVSGDTELDVVHDGIPPTGNGSGPGIETYSTTNPDDIAGTWRVVLTGQTASGAELRRDGTNPVMLATNYTYAWRMAVILLQNTGLYDVYSAINGIIGRTRVLDAFRNGAGSLHCPVKVIPANLYVSAGTPWVSTNTFRDADAIQDHAYGRLDQDWYGKMVNGDSSPSLKLKPWKKQAKRVVTVVRNDMIGAFGLHPRGISSLGEPGFPHVVAVNVARLCNPAAAPTGAAPYRPVQEPPPALVIDDFPAVTRAVIHECGHGLNLCPNDNHCAPTCVMQEQPALFWEPWGAWALWHDVDAHSQTVRNYLDGWGTFNSCQWSP
jgi:hypothetical protein